MTGGRIAPMQRVGGVDPASLGLLERYFGLSLAGEKEWLDSLETVELPGGDWLFRQGEPGDSLYFLIRGRLQVLRVADEADAGQGATLLGEVVAGESVGEVGLLTGHGRSAGVRAIRDSLLVRVDRAAFEQMAGRNPALILKLAASVADRLRQNIAIPRRRQPTAQDRCDHGAGSLAAHRFLLPGAGGRTGGRGSGAGCAS